MAWMASLSWSIADWNDWRGETVHLIAPQKGRLLRRLPTSAFDSTSG